MFEVAIRRTALALALFASILDVESRAESEETPDRDTLLVANSCVACHGPQGISSKPEVPHLAGQHAEYIVRALRAYRDGQRRGETMEAMTKVVAALSDKDMVNVAVYLASLEPSMPSTSSRR
jgi:cytochrome c553